MKITYLPPSPGLRTMLPTVGASSLSAALDYLTIHSKELKLNREQMFLTGDSAGGHLTLYMAEASEDASLPIRPKSFKTKGVMLNCPAYDFASFAEGSGFSKSALAWFIGPRYQDRQDLETMSPRTFIGSYSGPLLVSTCTHDFIRSQALLKNRTVSPWGASPISSTSNPRTAASVMCITSPAWIFRSPRKSIPG